MTTLGFIGTGGMGVGMAANLIKAGFKLVVNDLNPALTKPLEAQGAVFKDTPRAVAESCDIVLSMLPHNDAVRMVGLGKGGLCEATSGSKLWIDFSSIEVEHLQIVPRARGCDLPLAPQPLIAFEQLGAGLVSEVLVCGVHIQRQLSW